ncbi:MAG: deoxyguanosinetriphosphate triphosphohydrolase [Cyanobacteria bacterium]|nr:deoxyguanosinetriphosphate triphosphohydrolase [Cyanobacteriota bacterium]
MLHRQEQEWLHPFALQSAQSQGRKATEPDLRYQTVFQSDRNRIVSSKAFRRLKHKTQVFISPVGDHYRTRLTHTLEVSQVARTVARALRLNEDLTEAIALGHDLGHPPFGHTGEAILQELFPQGFNHEAQSVRIASIIEPLNLTAEVLDGMASQLNQTTPGTLEAQVVKMTDRMTYLQHDVEDAIRAGLMRETDIPADIEHTLGKDRKTRLETMIADMIEQSQQQFEKNQRVITVSEDVRDAITALRQWMFDHIYLSPSQVQQKQKVHRVLSGLVQHFLNHPEQIPQPEQVTSDNTPEISLAVLDYVSGMTDRYATDLYCQLLLPTPYPVDKGLDKGLFV